MFIWDLQKAIVKAFAPSIELPLDYREEMVRGWRAYELDREMKVSVQQPRRRVSVSITCT